MSRDLSLARGWHVPTWIGGIVLPLLATSIGAQTGDYEVLDNVESNWVNHNPIPIRPMALTRTGSAVWACNPYNNEIVRIDGSLTVVDRFRTLRAPVSVAIYHDGTEELVLVVSQANRCLVAHEAATGNVRQVLKLPAEPCDIVVDESADRAFIACSTADAVAEVNLATWAIVREFDINSKTPMFLSITDAGDVYVAPRWSGNNSAVHRHAPHPLVPNMHLNTNADHLGMLDLADPNIATTGLPDEDLFWLNRSTGQAEAVATGMGSILLAHGVNPDDGRYWQLNTEANNKDPNRQTEHSIQGEVSFNRLSIANVSPGSVVQPSLIVNLDDIDSGTSGIQYDGAQSVGIPYGLEFFDNGFAWVCGLLTDNVVLLDPNGQRVLEIDVPGDMPRQVLMDPTEAFLAVWTADLQVHVYLITGPSPVWLGSVPFGFDPTPADIQAGRSLFFDGSNSEHGNASCATCHDEGMHDLLAWNLSNGFHDDKGPMVTQTLVDIAKSTPFHWRGEQQNNLLDFNGAFPNLLGGTELGTGPGSDFEKFEKFVLSLASQSNPNQNRERVLDASIEPPLVAFDTDAVAGQDTFMDSCEGCHGVPLGTNNNDVNDGSVFRDPFPHRQFIKIAPFHSLHYRGFQPDVTVTWNPSHPDLGPVGTQEYPLIGIGMAHAGNPRNTKHFLEFFTGLSQQEQENVVATIHQWDLGTAPAVNECFLLNQDTASMAVAEVGYLMAENAKRNCDVAVFGRTTINGVNRVYGWSLFRSNGLFLRDDVVFNNPIFFLNQVNANPDDWFVFMGTPVGMGIPVAMDDDNDLYPNGLEATEADRWNVDSDGDTFWDGHEFLNGGDPHDPAVVPTDALDPGIVDLRLQWTTTNSARLTFETNELTTFSLSYDSGFAQLPLITATESDFKWQHGIVLTGFFHSLTYTGTLTVTDLAGRQTTIALPDADMELANDLPSSVILTRLTKGPSAIQVGTNNVLYQVTASVAAKQFFAPMADHMVVGRVLRDGVPASTILGATTSFKVNGVVYDDIPGPFVVSKALTDANGSVTFTFIVPNVAPSETIDFSIEAVGVAVDPANHDPSDPDMVGADAFPFDPIPISWSLPKTPAKARCINLQ